MGFHLFQQNIHLSSVTVDGRNPANQLRLVVNPIIYIGFYTSPGGDRRISEPSTVCVTRFHPRFLGGSTLQTPVAWRRFALHLDLRLSFGGFHFGVSPSIVYRWKPKKKHPWLGGGFKYFWNFHPETWGRFPFWLIFFKGVETTN